MKHWYATFDPLLAAPEARAMVEGAERFGSFKMYFEEPTFAGLGQGLPARFDAARNFVRSGGRFARREPLQVLAARTKLRTRDLRLRRRGAPSRHRTVPAPRRVRRGGAPALRPADHRAGDRLCEPPGSRPGARRPYRRPRVPRHQSPAARAVADRRDASLRSLRRLAHADRHRRRLVPRLCRRRVRLLSRGRGRSPGDPPGDVQQRDPPRHRHGLPRRRSRRRDGGASRPPPSRHAAPLRRRGRMERRRAGVVARYRWPELRYSISWKAYCFRDEAERTAWREHTDDLEADRVVDVLLGDLRRRGVVGPERPPDPELVEAIIDTYIRFPESRAA